MGQINGKIDRITHYEIYSNSYRGKVVLHLLHICEIVTDWTHELSCNKKHAPRYY